VHVIARPAIEAAKQRHPQCATWLSNWWQTASRANWQSLLDVRGDYPKVDQAGSCLVFGAPGGRRLIARIHYATADRQGTLYFRYFLTHAQYDRGDWKKRC
jgi:mRNA interferase HigB